MPQVLFRLAAMITLLGPASVAQAQAPAATAPPTVTIAVKSTQELEADLQFLTQLDTARGARLWPSIKDVLLPAFFQGIDSSKPIRTDIVLGGTRSVTLVLPVKKVDLKSFLSNVEGYVGGKSRATGADLYALKGPVRRDAAPPFAGQMRYLPTQGYAVIVESPATVPAGFQPLTGIESLLAPGFDLAATFQNNMEGAASRKAAIQSVRTDLTAEIRKVPGQSEDEIALRQATLTQQIDELERLFVEGHQMTLGWTTDAARSQATLDLDLTALAGTSLETCIAELAAKPSLFSAAARTENSIFFGRVNHALDAMRKKNIAALLPLMEKHLASRVEAHQDWDAARKAGYTAAIGSFFKLLAAGNEMGLIDGYIEVAGSGDSRSLIGAIRTPDGAQPAAVLSALKDAGWNVELDVAREGTAALHRVHLPQSENADFGLLFGKAAVIEVAVSPQAIYYAAGAGASDLLKKAVAETGEDASKNDGTFLDVWVKLGPWIEFLDQRHQLHPTDLSKLDAVARKNRESRDALRKAALSAFSGGDDTIHTQLIRKDQRITGRTTFSAGILRFIGMKLCDFAATL